MAKQVSGGWGLILTMNSTTIGEVDDIQGPSWTRDVIELKTVDATVKFKRFLKGVSDGGEFTFTLNFDDDATGHQALLVELGTKPGSAVPAWTLQLYDDDAPGPGTTLAFNGIITGFALKGGQADTAIQADVKIKISDEPTGLVPA